jgi:hypothetical protein
MQRNSCEVLSTIAKPAGAGWFYLGEYLARIVTEAAAK